MLQGQLVKLRALESTDLERVYTWINDREVTRYLAVHYPLSRADERRWLEGSPTNSFAGGVRFAIETNEGAHIGTLDLHRVSSENRSAGLGIMIGDKSCWSEGYGTDAIVTLLRFAFGEMNLNRVSLHVFEFNERAIACYEKCGFREEARLRENYYGEGRYWDVFVMGILRDEFQALNGASGEPGELETKA